MRSLTSASIDYSGCFFVKDSIRIGCLARSFHGLYRNSLLNALWLLSEARLLQSSTLSPCRRSSFSSMEKLHTTPMDFFASCLPLFLFQRTASSAKEKSDLAQFATSLLLSLVSTLRSEHPRSQRLHHLHPSCLTYGSEQAHFFSLLRAQYFFFCTVLPIAKFEHVPSHAVKRCRAVCTAKVLTVVHRRCAIVHCTAEMKIKPVYSKRYPAVYKKSTSAQL